MSTTISGSRRTGAATDNPTGVPAAVTAGARAGAGPKLLISVEEAAERLDIGRSLAFELIRTGRIRTIRVGRLRKVPVDALREFVEQQSTGGASAAR